MKKYKSLIVFLLCIEIFISSHKVFSHSLDYHKPLLKIIFFNVSQGDASLIQLPNKKNLLIDGGPGGDDYSRFDAGKKIILPYCTKNNIKKIHALIMTHPHSDHIGGLLSILKNFPVECIYDCGMPHTSELYYQCLEIIDKKRIKYKIPTSGDTIQLDPKVQISILHPLKNWKYQKEANNNSIVIMMRYGQIKCLFTGDIEKEVEKILIHHYSLESTLIKIPHHGADTSSSDDFIKAVNPKIGILSVGKHNSFNHPSMEVIKKYKGQNTKILRTDIVGHIMFITDGNHYTLKTIKYNKNL